MPGSLFETHAGAEAGIYKTACFAIRANCGQAVVNLW